MYLYLSQAKLILSVLIVCSMERFIMLFVYYQISSNQKALVTKYDELFGDWGTSTVCIFYWTESLQT